MIIFLMLYAFLYASTFRTYITIFVPSRNDKICCTIFIRKPFCKFKVSHVSFFDTANIRPYFGLRKIKVDSFWKFCCAYKGTNKNKILYRLSKRVAIVTRCRGSRRAKIPCRWEVRRLSPAGSGCRISGLFRQPGLPVCRHRNCRLS